MRDGLIIQLLLAGYGAMIMSIAVGALVRRKMTVGVCVPWGIVAVVFIVLGIVVRPDSWKEYLSLHGLILIIAIFLCATYALYFLSSNLSMVLLKTTDLAMQVSILNAETEELREKIKELEENKQENEENSIRD